MNKLRDLSINERITFISMLLWTLITFTNYFNDEKWRGWNSDPHFHSPYSVFKDFFNILFSGQTTTYGYDGTELMIYAVLPWLVFLTYLIFKDKK